MRCCFLLIRHPPKSTLFPCTTLFRSQSVELLLDRLVDPTLSFRHRRFAGLGDALGVVPRRFLPHRIHTFHVGDLAGSPRSEEHTSELQSRQYLVCRLLLEKKKATNTP